MQCRLLDDYDVVPEPAPTQLVLEETEKMPPFQTSNLIVGRDTCHPKPPNIPERSSVIETSIHDILKQNIPKVSFALLRVSSALFREFRTPGARELGDGQPFPRAPHD